MQPREAFDYESNALLIRHILVPEPFNRIEWETFVEEWKRSLRNESLLEWLVSQQKISEHDLLACLSECTGSKVLNEPFDNRLTVKSPESEMLEKLGFLPIATKGGKNLVAGGSAMPPALSEYLGDSAKNWEWVIISPVRIQKILQDGDETNPAIETGLRQLLKGFWSRGVTDIHFERKEDILQIRTHESGTMHTVENYRGQSAETTMRLLKTWAGLSTATDSLPQDSRISLEISGIEVELRVSHLTTVNGESLVLRNPDGKSGIRQIRDLGMPSDLEISLRDTLLHDPGLIVISGPTGSGKTTTAYALLNELQGENRKIVSIEDPVEHILAHAVQCEVDLNKGWTFDKAILAFLRQDPDVIFIGEMRDAESAKAAFRAALTGHCVLVTIHARSTMAVLDRIRSWSIPDGIMEDTIRIIVNQRIELNPRSIDRVAKFTWQKSMPEINQAV